MKSIRFFLPAIFLSTLSWGAVGYSRFSHPKGDYVVDYPADWKQSIGLQSLRLRPSGKETYRTKVSIERYPLSKGDPPTAKQFIEKLLDKSTGLKKLEARKTVKVSGRDAERLEFVETKTLKGAYDQPLPGPLREIYIVIPLQHAYYLLRLESIADAYVKTQPEFEKIAEKFQLRKDADSIIP